MAFPRLSLHDAPQPAAGLPTRADVAVFAGLIARTAAPVPPAVHDALVAAGWEGPLPPARTAAQLESLLDVPVAVDSWGAFAELYAWDQRLVEKDAPQTIPSRLGLAVRSFFGEGGARAWIVRTGDPLPLISHPVAPDADGAAIAAAKNAAEAAKRSLITWPPLTAGGSDTRPADAAERVPLIPGLGGEGSSTAPSSWHGVEHIWGIDDAALLLLPDLAELVAPAPAALAAAPAPPHPPEDWKACAPPTPEVAIAVRTMRPAVEAPRLDPGGYKLWATHIRAVLDKLAAPGGAAHRRDVMLIASLPLPAHGDATLPPRCEAWPLALLDLAGVWLHVDGQPPTDISLFDRTAIGSARLQLAWPWVETAASALLPEGVEGGEGAVAGVLARSALALGAFRSAAGSPVSSVRRLFPELGSSDLERGLPDGRADWMGDRLTLIGIKRNRFALLSDSTVSSDRRWRAGGTSRLVGIVLRAARWLGDERLFGPSGPALWAGLRSDVEAFLEKLRAAGALAGARAADAYDVRCDRTTMTQQDIDAGRTIVRIAINPAQPVGWITVTLALGGGGDTLLERAA